MTLKGYKTADAVEALGGETKLLSFLEAVARDSEVGIHEAERMMQEKGVDISGTTIRRWCDELGIEWQGAQSGPEKVIDRAIEAVGSKKTLLGYLRSAAEDSHVTYADVINFFDSIEVDVSKPTLRGWLDDFGIEWRSTKAGDKGSSMKEILASALQALMESSGMTTEELANKINVPEKIVTYWTNGQLSPHAEVFDVLSEAVENRRERIRKRTVDILAASSDIIGDTKEVEREAETAAM